MISLTDIRGNPLGVIRLSRTNRRTIVIEQNGHTVGIPTDSLTHVADMLVDLAEALEGTT